MGTRIEALQEMCAQFERNAADARRECDALRETLGRVVAERNRLSVRVSDLERHCKMLLSRTQGYSEMLDVADVRIHTFNSAPLWRRILTAIRGDL